MGMTYYEVIVGGRDDLMPDAPIRLIYKGDKCLMDRRLFSGWVCDAHDRVLSVREISPEELSRQTRNAIDLDKVAW